MECMHKDVICLNEYELIRKYRCLECGNVMMCNCDENIARKFLSHQIDQGCELDTQKRVKVTLGFQPGICRECRGFPPKAAPVASIYGRTSKIKRFYWREIAFREFELLNQYNLMGSNKEIEQQALNDIKELHKNFPKYSLYTKSEENFIRRLKIDILKVMAQVKKGGNILCGDGTCKTPEDFAINYFCNKGYNCLKCESVPFHVIFSVFFAKVIQDKNDLNCREIYFYDRLSYDSKRIKDNLIITYLPDDFGTKGYYNRRKAVIIKAISTILKYNKIEIIDHFKKELVGSNDLRQYLWAYRRNDIELAREIIKVLSVKDICNILHYLIKDYWGNYLGWPDLLIHNDKQLKFVEVKLAKDKLSENQRNWIENNDKILNFNFSLFKIHKNISTSY